MINQVLPRLVVNVLNVLQHTFETMCVCCRVRVDRAKDKTVLTRELSEKLGTGLQNYVSDMSKNASVSDM